MSLPRVFATRLDTIPADIPYLTADPALLAAWSGRLGPRTRMRVGLAWSGRASFVNDRTRSMSLARMARVLTPECEFFSLHREVRPDDAALLERLPAIRHFGAALTDFADTAALASLMDVVVTTDSSFPSGRRLGAAGVDPAVPRSGMALAAGSRRQSLVSDSATGPADCGRGLGDGAGPGPDGAGGRGVPAGVIDRGADSTLPIHSPHRWSPRQAMPMIGG